MSTAVRRRPTRLEWIAIAVVIVVIAAGWFLLRSQQGSAPTSNYVLVDDGTGICFVGEQAAFIHASDLPDTVPTYFPHMVGQQFDNRRFHFLSVSPNQRYIAFSSGEGDQWIGMFDMEGKYMKFVMFGSGTSFYPGSWSPDNRFFSVAFFGPDRRMCVAIVEPTIIEEPIPKMTNLWFEYIYKGEKFRPIGWSVKGDTTYSFAVTSAEGQDIKTVDLPLRFKQPETPQQ